MQIPEFVRASRTTVMTFINAESETTPQIFVFKGAKPPYRQVVFDELESSETCASYLLRGPSFLMRNDISTLSLPIFLS